MKDNITKTVEIRFGFLAEDNEKSYCFVLLDPFEITRIPKFKGATLGNWYHVDTNGDGTLFPAPELFKTRRLTNDGAIQVCFFVLTL